jgi:hypothetical protein
MFTVVNPFFAVVNPITGESFEFEDEVLANAKAEEIREEVLTQEQHRFTVVKEIVDGPNTTWVPVDINSAVEAGVYCVFNTLTGQHERVESMDVAKTRIGEIKQEFLDSLQIITFMDHEAQIASMRSQLKYENVQSMLNAAPLGVTRLGD